MAEPKVFFVYLRRPHRNNPKERRDDPFYEFGSFGCTGCHSSNLLHRRHTAELKGARLAFVQGGKFGARLVFLTPPVAVKVWTDRCEVRWKPAQKPFKYTEAPILACNDGRSDFPLVRRFARETGCTTVEGGLSSRLRSRASPLPTRIARQVIAVYEEFRAAAPRSALASSYDEALPYAPPKTDHNRRKTYEAYLKRLRRWTGENAAHSKTLCGKTGAKPDCGRSRCRRSKPRKRRCT